MTRDEWVLIAIVVFGVGALTGIFLTKTKGFGRYTTSLLLLTLVLVISALFLAVDKIEPSLFANIAFAVVGLLAD